MQGIRALTTGGDHHPGDSDPDMDEALRRVRENSAQDDLIWPTPTSWDEDDDEPVIPTIPGPRKPTDRLVEAAILTAVADRLAERHDAPISDLEIGAVCLDETARLTGQPWDSQHVTDLAIVASAAIGPVAPGTTGGELAARARLISGGVV